MIDDRESVAKRIEKLLNLAKSGNEHEATAAMLKAHALMRQYSLSVADVDVLASDWLTVDCDTVGKRCEKRRNVLHVLAKFFDVEFFSQKTRAGRVYKVFGEQHKVSIALYVYNFLCATFERLWQEERKRSGLSVSDRNSYFAGLQRGLSETLRRNNPIVSEEQEQGLVKASNALAVALSQHYPGLVSSKLRLKYTDAVHLGQRDGKNINIREGVTSGSGQKQLR